MASNRPQDLVFILFGEYLTHPAQPVWVGSLIALLRPFGVSEGAVRTVLSRMTQKRWLASHRRGRHSFYHLTTRGRRVVDQGKARVFHPPAEPCWDGEWCLLAYSVPEDVRHLRDRLRIRLSWLGFGPLGNGVWVCPHKVEDQVAALAADMGLGDMLVTFRARQVGSVDAAELVARCWDLPALSERYKAFLSTWAPHVERCGARGGVLGDEEAFALRVRLIRDFHEFPLVDPFLPSTLLPERWPGHLAADVFQSLHDSLVAQANRYVASVLEQAPSIVGRSRPVPA